LKPFYCEGNPHSHFLPFIQKNIQSLCTTINRKKQDN
jgi:hypothetical protein